MEFVGTRKRPSVFRTVGTWAEKTQPSSAGNLEDLPPLLPSLSSTKGLVLDLTDPLNLNMRWRFSADESWKDVSQKDLSLKPLSSPVLVQLGRDQYAERLKRLEEKLHFLNKEHREIKSIDLRLPDRVTLVPLPKETNPFSLSCWAVTFFRIRLVDSASKYCFLNIHKTGSIPV